MRRSSFLIIFGLLYASISAQNVLICQAFVRLVLSVSCILDALESPEHCKFSELEANVSISNKRLAMRTCLQNSLMLAVLSSRRHATCACPIRLFKCEGIWLCLLDEVT